MSRASSVVDPDTVISGIKFLVSEGNCDEPCPNERRNFLKAATQTLIAPRPCWWRWKAVFEGPDASAANTAFAPGLNTPQTQAVKPQRARLRARPATARREDTLAIQLAIERCSVFGGGEVVCPRVII